MQQQPAKLNGFCLSALILGILMVPAGYLIYTWPYLGGLSLFGFFGGGIGLIGLLTFKRDKQRGLVIGIIGLALCVAFVIISRTQLLTRDYI